MKKIAILPTLLTLGNGICGFAAIAYASRIDHRDFPPETYPQLFAYAGWLILIAMVCDMFDGVAARLTKTAGKFGGELDSLCDAISFGLAPAFILLKMGPGWMPRPFLHQLLAGIAAIYVSCTVLRLARFNVDNTPDPSSHKRFKGLPSPGAAGCIAALAIFRGEFASTLINRFSVEPVAAQQIVKTIVETVAPLGALIVGLLMVSMVSYPHFTNQVLRGRRHVGHLLQVLMAGLIIFMMPDLALVLLFWGYALGMPAWNFLTRLSAKTKAPAIQPETRTP